MSFTVHPATVKVKRLKRFFSCCGDGISHNGLPLPVAGFCEADNLAATTYPSSYPG
jgi:hypothetical protein